MINEYGTSQPINENTSANGNTLSNDEVISTLNGLIETCKDGQDGFKAASEGIQRSDLKSVFYEFSQQRAEFAGILQEQVRLLGGDPEKSGSMSAAVHRGWMDIKSVVTGKDEGAILNECERGEDYAKEAYSDALKKGLPANVADIIAQQSHAVLTAHNRIRSLRDKEAVKSATQA